MQVLEALPESLIFVIVTFFVDMRNSSRPISMNPIIEGVPYKVVVDDFAIYEVAKSLEEIENILCLGELFVEHLSASIRSNALESFTVEQFLLLKHQLDVERKP
jgi:hypothetical protein